MTDIDSKKFDAEALADAHIRKSAPKKMHPAQRMANEIVYIKDAINLAWELDAYREMAQLADYLKQVRQEYKMELFKPS